MGLGLTKTSSKSSKKNNTTSSTTPQTTTQQTTAATTTTPTSTTSSNTAPSNFKGSATGVTAYNQAQSDIISQMNANSIAWHTATPEEQARLAAANQALSQQLGGSVTFDANTGYWSGAAEAPVEVGDEPTFDYSVAQPNFGNSYGNALDEMLNKILTREDFKYNAEDDPLYQQYAEMYRREGDRARENTLADIASSAGGMNSWAVTAAQQAQNNYNAQLGDKIPELYQLAYQMYLNEKASMVEDFGLLQQMDSTQYNRYRDTMSDWRDDRNFAFDYYLSDLDKYKWGTEFNYGVSQDQIANDNYNKEWEYGVSTDEYNREQAENETAYNREQQEINDARAWAIDLINAGTTPDAATLQKAGLTLAQAQEMAAAQKASKTKTSSGSSGGSTTMDLDGLFEAALASDSPEVYLQNSSYLKKYGVGKYSDELVDAYEQWFENRGTGGGDPMQKLYNSINALGIGPVTASRVAELKEVGGIVENADGTVKWADGWNKDNYEWLEELAYQNRGLNGTSK